jgi:RNA polymerase sigma factor (TIGR02999 family)
MAASDGVTALLAEASAGRRDALDRLIPIVYEELRQVAHRRLREERADHTLNTTALVHETYLKLIDVKRVEWRDRVHFFGVAASAMRRILIDHARTRNREKRGGSQAARVPLDFALNVSADRDEELIALDDALARLEAANARYGRVVECRFFAGLTLEETAEVLGTSLATVKRDWAFCRAWLNRELRAPSAPRGSALPIEAHG